MKVKINYQERDFEPGIKFAQVVHMIRESKKEEPMIKAIVGKEGKDYITFILNGRIVRPAEYDSIELKEGDDIRWVHPMFGG